MLLRSSSKPPPPSGGMPPPETPVTPRRAALFAKHKDFKNMESRVSLGKQRTPPKSNTKGKKASEVMDLSYGDMDEDIRSVDEEKSTTNHDDSNLLASLEDAQSSQRKEGEIPTDPNANDQDPNNAQFMILGDFIFKRNVVNPIGWTFNGAEYFASPEVHQEFADAGYVSQFQPEMLDNKNPLKWNKRLASYPKELSFDLPQELPAGFNIELYQDDQKIQECPKIDERPILPAPVRPGIFSPQTSRVIPFTLNPNF